MVTYDTLIQFGLLIVAIIGLVYKIAKNKPPFSQVAVYFLPTQGQPLPVMPFLLSEYPN